MAKDDLAIVVFTADTLDWILRQGGSGDWVVSAKKATAANTSFVAGNRTGITERRAFLVARPF